MSTILVMPERQVLNDRANFLSSRRSGWPATDAGAVSETCVAPACPPARCAVFMKRSRRSARTGRSGRSGTGPRTQASGRRAVDAGPGGGPGIGPGVGSVAGWRSIEAAQRGGWPDPRRPAPIQSVRRHARVISGTTGDDADRSPGTPALAPPVRIEATVVAPRRGVAPMQRSRLTIAHAPRRCILCVQSGLCPERQPDLHHTGAVICPTEDVDVASSLHGEGLSLLARLVLSQAWCSANSKRKKRIR